MLEPRFLLVGWCTCQLSPRAGHAWQACSQRSLLNPRGCFGDRCMLSKCLVVVLGIGARDDGGADRRQSPDSKSVPGRDRQPTS